MARSRRRISTVVYRLFVLAAAAITGLIAAELLLRLVNPSMSYGYMPQEIRASYLRPSTFILSELRPSNRSRFKMLEFDTTVITNSLGLRDNEVDFTKPRILCLGDSFTFGYGVENDETFCARLEELFGGQYDFVNAGFADGYAPSTYALWLTRYRERLSPSMILVNFFQNDSGDVRMDTWIKDGQVMGPEDTGLPDKSIRPGYIVTDDGVGMRDNWRAMLPVPIRRWMKMSYVVAFLRSRVIRDLDSADTAQPERDVAAEAAAEAAIDAAEDRKFNRSLDLMQDAAGDTPLVFYVIGGLVGLEELAPSKVDRLVTAYARTHDIPLLMNHRGFTTDDFFPQDMHFKPSGHEKAAAYLFRELSRLGLRNQSGLDRSILIE
jgi:hypothetical protein